MAVSDFKGLIRPAYAYADAAAGARQAVRQVRGTQARERAIQLLDFPRCRSSAAGQPARSMAATPYRKTRVTRASDVHDSWTPGLMASKSVAVHHTGEW